MSAGFDVAVIGAGSGGLVAAVAAANFGQRVILFEAGEMGGECLNTGCVPSKALLAAARAVQQARDAARLGITADPHVDMAAVRAHVRATIAAIAPHDSQARMEALGIRVVRAAARFRDATTLEAAGEAFVARRIIIASGSHPAVPPIPGLAGTAFLTNESLFDLDGLPRHLIVIGGGPIGVEMAQAHRRLGAEVTLLEAGRLLGREDPELAQVVADRLAADGVVVRTNVAIISVAQDDKGFSVALDDGARIAGSHLMVATGRRANIDSLNLAAAGIAATANGITVDRRMRTSVRHIYAIGDCVGPPQFTHLAAHQAELVICHALFRLPVDARKTIVPRVTFGEPELAQAGLTEAEARAAHGPDIKVLRQPFSGNDRALADADSAGLVKVVAGRRGAILGVGIVGSGAGDLIQPWLVAMNNGLGLRAILGSLLPYPTRGEASRRAALHYYAGVAGNPWLRRAISLLAKLG